MASGGDGGEPNWAWLGLLKWSLSYTDGTKPSEESLAPMSKEDREFLEEVMKDGIIDEGKRMNTILTELTDSLQTMKDDQLGKSPTDEDKKKEYKEEDMEELLEELRDIVEQIDYAKAFSAMGGLKFLLGCASERDAVPKGIRSNCLAVLGTMCQNNPAVQYSMLELGALRILIDLYFAEFNDPNKQHDLSTRIVQTMSCAVRSHAMAEKIFCDNEAGRMVIETGLGLRPSKNKELQPPSLQLCKRSLFFLQALVTSDHADKDRIKQFNPCIVFLIQQQDQDWEIREMVLSMILRIISQNICIEAVFEHKKTLVGLAVNRISTIRSMPPNSEERDLATTEMSDWETLLVELTKI